MKIIIYFYDSDMICANGHKHLLEEMIKIINEKFPKEKENIINHKNCDGNTPLRKIIT